MKRILAALIALIVLLTASAFAQEVEWVDLDLMDFSVTVPEDVIGFIEDTYTSGVPFAAFYQDYNQDRYFNKNVAFAYTEEYLDIYSYDPFDYANYIAGGLVESYATMGIKAEQPEIIDAGLDQQDGKDALFMSFATKVDYSGLGYNEAYNLFTVQMVLPYAEGAYTYIVTLTTDNPDESDILFKIADSLKWI